jgi:cyanophycin synthetase
LVGATRTQQTQEIRGEFKAIDVALANLKAGELCLILIDQVDEALEYIGKKVAAG